VWIDVHTGLGPFGLDTVATEKPILLDEMKKWFPTPHDHLTPDAKNTGALDGYELVQGSLLSLIYKTSQNTVLGLTQEFGTIPGVLVARASILENMMHNYGDEEGRRTWGRAWMQPAYYPQSTIWRASIVKRGIALILESLEYIVANQSQEEPMSADQ